MIANKSAARLLNSIFALNLCTSLALAAPSEPKQHENPKGAQTVEEATHANSSVASTSVESKSKAAKRPHMDVAFCIDTTASMQGEIDMVKTKTKEMVAKLSSGKPAPVIRVGLVAYRDIGDQYVTKVFPFSEDIDQVVKDISSLQAMGGGDGPEAVDRGLHAAIKELHWDGSAHTAKLLFLIGDAGPHGYANDLDWRADCRDAIKDGIQINTMGCHGLENYPPRQGVDVFKEIARLTDGKYESLAYRQEIVDALGKHSTIVHSGGAMYKMNDKAGLSWKGAVARGMMEKVSPSSMESYAAAAPAAAGAAFGGAGAAPSMMAESRMASSRSLSASTNAPARSDNNLDQLMLDAAKAKAEKSLRVGY